MSRPTRLLTAATFYACVSLSACSGGGSSVSSTSTPAQLGTNTGTASDAASGFTVSGLVSGITGVSIGLTGTSTGSTTTDTSGDFSFASLSAGKYTVSPSKSGYLFSPVSQAAIVTDASVTGLTFSASASTAATYTLSGSVAGSAIAGVEITLNGANVGSTVTDLSGNYAFTGLASGTYTVTASLNGYSFSSCLLYTSPSPRD